MVEPIKRRTPATPVEGVGLGAQTTADTLKPGDQILTFTGTRVLILTTTHTRPTPVHNLTIPHHRTYYVLAGKTAVLVHNCGGAGVTNGRPHSTSCACASGASPRIPNNPYGGRGKPSTQAQLNDIHDELTAANPDWTQVAGGSLPERNIVGPGGVPRRADLEYQLPDGSPFFVNTVTTYADGVTATSLELANAIDIMMWGRGPVLMIPKIP